MFRVRDIIKMDLAVVGCEEVD